MALDHAIYVLLHLPKVHVDQMGNEAVEVLWSVVGSFGAIGRNPALIHDAK